MDTKKKGAKEAELAEKKAAREAEKAAAKAAKKNANKEGNKEANKEETDEELGPEMNVEVRVFEHDGCRYLKDDTGALYSSETHEEVGMWDATTNKVELRQQPSTGYVREGDELCDP